jgi:hypothetical protein
MKRSMEQNEFCPFCDHFIEEGIDPSIDFPCFHRAHSSCFLRLLNNETYSLAEQYRRCQFCEATLFDPDDEVGEEEAEDAHVEGYIENEVVDEVVDAPDEALTLHERIRNQVLGNKELQAEIKAYIKAKRACGPKRAALKKFVVKKKLEIKESVESLRDQLKSLLQAQKNIIRQSEFFRGYQGALFKVFLMRGRIKNRYNLNMNSVRMALKNEPGFRQLTRDFSYHTSASYILRRSFYRRYIRC